MVDPLLPYLARGPKGYRGWPLHEVGGRVEYRPLSWLLATEHPDDAHTGGYSVPSVLRRLTTGAEAKVAGGVPMVTYLFDVDCAKSHRALGGSSAVHADDAWWASQVPRLEALLLAHPGGYVYRTRGGFRIVYCLPQPHVITDGASELEWKRRYLAALAYFARAFELVGDPSISDFPRLLRLPRVTRDGRMQRYETIGDPSRIGAFEYAPTDADEALDLAAVRRLAERERVLSLPVVGDAMARPLLDLIETGDYDLSGLMGITNGGAPLSPTVRDRLLTALPNAFIMDAVGASESGAQMTTIATKGAETKAATFTPLDDTTVVSADFSRVLQPGEGEGWLARREFVPLGYLGDAEKTARTFPTIDGVRWSIPGDKARLLADGQIELLGRDSVTINSGGEKIFAEEVERAVASHPAVYDVVVTGRPSERWGNEVVAIVEFAEGRSATDAELAEACKAHIADYKIPKAFIRTDKVLRSPAGKADYRWAKALAAESLGAQG